MKMKHLGQWILMLMTLAILTVPVWAQEEQGLKAVGKPARLIPTIKLENGTTLDISGWSWLRGYYSENTDPKFQQTNRLNLSLDGQRWGLGAVFDLSYDQRSEEFNKNYFLEFYGRCKLNDTLTVKLGNILKSCGRGNAIKGPHIWPTIGYPGYPKGVIPYGNYATGGKIELKLENFFASLDITGRGDVPFDDPNRFDWIEASGLIRYDLEEGSIGGVFEKSQKWLCEGVFVEWQPLDGRLFIRCELDGTQNFNEQISNTMGGFIDVTARLSKHFAISGLGVFNESYSKTYELTTVSKGKDGFYKPKTEIKHTPGGTESGVGLFVSWYVTNDESLIAKLGAYQRLEENANNESFPPQLSTEINKRF